MGVDEWRGNDTLWKHSNGVPRRCHASITSPQSTNLLDTRIPTRTRLAVHGVSSASFALARTLSSEIRTRVFFKAMLHIVTTDAQPSQQRMPESKQGTRHLSNTTDITDPDPVCFPATYVVALPELAVSCYIAIAL